MDTSYYHRPAVQPFLDDTFGQLLEKAAVRWPDREAYVFRPGGTRVTFTELKVQVDELAAGLLALGTQRGDRIGWIVDNRLEWVLMYFAVAKVGAISVPLENMFDWNSEVAIYMLNKVKVKTLVLQESDEDDAYSKNPLQSLIEIAPELETCQPGQLKNTKLPFLETVIAISDRKYSGCYMFTDVQQMGGEEEHRRLDVLQTELSAKDPGFLFCTSGSTGMPKFVQHSTYALVNSCGEFFRMTGIDKQPKCLFPSAAESGFWDVHQPIVFGNTMVFPSAGKATVTDLLSTIQEERCGAVAALLFIKQFHELLHHPQLKDYDLSSLEMIHVGGNVVHESLIHLSTQLLPNVKILNLYAMTEVVCVSTVTPDMSLEAASTTVGKIFPEIEVKLVDGSGDTVPLGQDGEVWVKGYSVFQGYCGDEDTNRSIMSADGWCNTGDIGRLGEDGLLTIVGRSKDVILKDDENVYPVLLERIFHEICDKVKIVKAIGVPHESLVEEICICMVLKDGETATEGEMREMALNVGVSTVAWFQFELQLWSFRKYHWPLLPLEIQ
ncbi:PREDICTED: acyl-CoA synthetase family member 2, mitochondrial-like isoform X1 [Branchiostoma belcheri]|uniref:Acyl-CoA synthetase family member 2, mitochondrial-like isoform X1 n=1 Tax=Branchiostoma belcheri TaxID=7741 RepID=A0A6P4YQ49_BRABE|nr:PREDICTED: acyl-CoA synthetase family member 2, mitochondrial-like isoform X1 [Branchiostoma belcheri]